MKHSSRHPRIVQSSHGTPTPATHPLSPDPRLAHRVRTGDRDQHRARSVGVHLESIRPGSIVTLL